ncbi:MAG TPA: hypothetical protein PLT82_12725 [Candidatus Hydrogenedens sp.]|nr:hypothetical protein [Candidatus Hydrogenedens sp.]HOL21169.1 hypothetical protein [Candidatus Hydrogenedens sp.]HPP59986.1 hypothetical protein [Candidatus Hydrogenedens sp.]
MKFTVTCPYCSKEVPLNSSEVGQKVICPYCNKPFVVKIIEPIDKSETPPIADKSKLSFHPELEESKQLINKVEKDIDEMEAENILDKFYALEELISNYIEEQKYDPDTKVALLVIASKKQIEISKQVKEHLQKNSPGLPLPAHIGYITLSDIRERQGIYEECIIICQQALEEGWTGDWQIRLNRCRKTSMIKKRKT